MFGMEKMWKKEAKPTPEEVAATLVVEDAVAEHKRDLAETHEDQMSPDQIH